MGDLLDYLIIKYPIHSFVSVLFGSLLISFQFVQFTFCIIILILYSKYISVCDYQVFQGWWWI